MVLRIIKSRYLWLSILCISALLASFITRGISFVLLCLFITGMLVYKKSNPREKKFILTVYIITLILRVIIAYGYQWHIDTHRNGLSFATDESYYLALGWYNALFLKMKDVSQISETNYSFLDEYTKNVFLDYLRHYGGRAFSVSGREIYGLLLGIFYFIFGYSFMLARYLNIFIGMLAVLAVYTIARDVFGEKIARLSLAIFAFMPCQFFISVSIMRDALIMLSIILAVFILYKINDVKTAAIFTPLLTLIFLSLFYSQKFIFLLLLSILPISVLIKLLDFKQRLASSATIAVIIIFLLFSFNISPHLFNFFQKNIYTVFVKHIGIAKDPSNTGSSCYKLLPNRFYNSEDYIFRRRKAREITLSKKGYSDDGIKAYGDFAEYIDNVQVLEQKLFCDDIKRYVPSAYLKGLMHVLFKPIPSLSGKFTHRLASVHMIFWYLLFPFVCVGLFKAIMNPTKDKMILVIVFFSFVSGLALGEGNTGSLFRHREVISFAYIILGSSGLTEILYGRERKKEVRI